MLIIQTFVFNPFFENTYLIWDEESSEAAIIDPGCSDENEKNVISDFVSAKKLTIKYLINTHCHIDHILGNFFIKEKYNPEYLMSEKDMFLQEIMINEASKFGVSIEGSPAPDKYLENQSEIHLGKKQGVFLYTPGHSPGEYSLYFPEPRYCFTGDVLFREGIGRTDLWGGDYDILIKSIKEKLFLLPDETEIFPGHGDKSTIGYEKEYNPFLI